MVEAKNRGKEFAFGAFTGVTSMVKGMLQLKKVRKANIIETEYIEKTGLVHPGLEGIINDERTMLVVRGINKLFIVWGQNKIAETLASKVYVYEGSHRTLDFTDEKTYIKYPQLKPIKEVFEKISNDLVTEGQKKISLEDFTHLKLSDLGYQIDFGAFKTIKDEAFDFSADSFLVMSRQWFTIGQKEPPLILIAVGIISLLFGVVTSSIAFIFIWFLIEVLRIIIK